jgi:hypothetical protein
MIEIPLATLKSIAGQLNELGVSWTFTGGSIIGLLMDEPALGTTRPTDDVDVIIEILAQKDYAKIEARLRQLGFQHDDSEGAPMCRWLFQNKLTVDIMPTPGGFLGLSTKLFAEALESSQVHRFDEVDVRVISPPCFLATKHEAFLDRGKGDYFASHDLEDFITVVDAREAIVEEVHSAQPTVSAYLESAVGRLLRSREFIEALPGHLPPDAASQQRLPLILKKLKGIAAEQG